MVVVVGLENTTLTITTTTSTSNSSATIILTTTTTTTTLHQHPRRCVECHLAAHLHRVPVQCTPIRSSSSSRGTGPSLDPHHPCHRVGG